MKHLTILFLLPLFILGHGSARADYSGINQFLSLGGSGYISVPYSPTFNYNLQMSGIFSIDAWVRPASLGSYMTIVGNDWTYGYWFGITPSGNLRFYPRGGQYFDSPGSIAAGQWSHVAMSINVGKRILQYYINGSLNTTISLPQTYIGAGQVDLRIGADRQGGSPSYHWNGGIDEVRFWSDEINFASAAGLLYRIPHDMVKGRWGRYLIGGWRFNGNANDIMGTNNGSPVGSVAYSTNPLPPHYPRICAAMTNVPGSTYPGDIDYFAIQRSASVSLLMNYTIECWVKPSAIGGGTSYQAFVSKGSEYALTRSYWLGLNKSNNRVRFIANGQISEALESSVSLPIGSWSHVAARFTVIGTNRTADLFINGILRGTRLCSSIATANTFDLLIGRDDTPGMPSSGDGFAGSIDEVRLWSIPRSDDEIADNHRLELDGSIPGLVANYHFDGNADDYSGYGNDANHVLHQYSNIWFADASDLPPFPTVQVLVPNGGETWYTGSTRTVQWNANGLVNVRVELSRDGGQSYTETLASKVPASPGSLSWFVRGPLTQLARIRVTTPSPTWVGDESDKNFAIDDPPPTLDVNPLTLTFTASRNGPLPPPQKVRLSNSGGQTLSWTASVTAGNAWCQVMPTSGFANTDSFEVSMTTSDLAETTHYGEITLGGNASNAGLKVNVRYVITNRPVYSISGHVTLNSADLPNIPVLLAGDASEIGYTNAAGVYTFNGVTDGNYTVTPLSSFFDFTPASRSFTPLNGIVTNADFVARTKQGTMRIRFKMGWNLISLPLVPSNGNVATLFPQSDGKAYYYVSDSGYVPTTSMDFGRGYWVKFNVTDSVEVAGTLQATLTTRLHATLGGWNLVGVPSNSVAIASIVQSPAGAMTQLYDYDPWLGYLHPSDGMLHPGRAYFVKTIVDADITMNITPFAPPRPPTVSVRFPGAELTRDLPPPPPRTSE